MQAKITYIFSNISLHLHLNKIIHNAIKSTAVILHHVVLTTIWIGMFCQKPTKDFSVANVGWKWKRCPIYQLSR